MILLLFVHLFTMTFLLFMPAIVNIVQIISAVLISLIALSIVCKGIIPIVFCVLGIVLIFNSITLPFSVPEKNDQTFGAAKFADIQNSPLAMATATNMRFFLGVGMVVLSMIVAYKPSILFTKNRPSSMDSEWSKYPTWHDNTLLEGGNMEQAIPLRNLMTTQDRYLLWRYECVLAKIYGTPHLVRPDSLVPKDSTHVFRDRASGRLVGRARFSGYFM
jgi:hypothetical protein